jgi:hypothetical protein
MIKKSLAFGLLGVIAAFLLVSGCKNDITAGDLVESRREFVNTDPTIGTLDKALTYFPKWVFSSVDGVDGVRPYQSVSFSPALFSVGYDFDNLKGGSYAYKLEKNTGGYLLSLSDWIHYAPTDPDSLRPAAQVSYDPDKLEITFSNVEGSDFQVWGDEGTVFAPDMTPYFEEAGLTSSSWIHISAGNVPQTGSASLTLSWDAGNLKTDVAALNVFPALTSTSAQNTPYWGVIGKDRKLIVGSGGTDLGVVAFNPGENLTIGGEKFASKVPICTYICDYRYIECCSTPYNINGTWDALAADGNVNTADPLVLTIAGGAGRWKAETVKDNGTAVSAAVYGAGLASITTANTLFWVSGSGENNTILYTAEYVPLLELVDVSGLENEPGERTLVIKPAGVEGASNITLKRRP